ncbi:MAG: class I SAM-dependent methyltransferase [Gemmatimonadota bacterium]
MLETHRNTNRELWAGWTAIHSRMNGGFYDLAAVQSGQTSLHRIELNEIGEVAGKSLLHLQCHLGYDTISWARLGARVTGVDFSPEAIAFASTLAQSLKVDVDFVCSDVYDIADSVPARFDIIFASYGVIPWLDDLRGWARIIADRLRPGGKFYIVDFHPLLYALDNDGRTLKHDYLSSAQPIHYVEYGSYADPQAAFSHPCYIWSHGLGEVVDALVSAGLALEFVREHPYSPYGSFPFLEQRADGLWWIKNNELKIPLLFSIRARRD